VNWKEKSVVIRQETRFPEEAGTRLVIQTKSFANFSLNLRIPYWADNASVTINGKRFRPNEELAPSSYAKIDRTWKDGDHVEVKLPVRLHLQTIPDDPKLAAIMYGPLVLAGELGAENLDPKRIYSDDKFLHGGFSAIAVPELAGDRNALHKWIRAISAKDKRSVFAPWARAVLETSLSVPSTACSISVTAFIGASARSSIGKCSRPRALQMRATESPKRAKLPKLSEVQPQRIYAYAVYGFSLAPGRHEVDWKPG
jgi:hypothetical protein